MARSVTDPVQLELLLTVLLLLCAVCGVWGSQVVVPLKVSAVLGRNVTLGCRIEVDSNSTLVQSSWEKRQSSGSVTLAVYSPVFGVAVPPEYEGRLSFRSPSTRDATIVLEDVGFADSGIYTCKVSTFPLGSAEASASVSVDTPTEFALDPPSTTATPLGDKQRALFTPPALLLHEGDLAGLVCGALFLLLVVGGVYYQRRRRTPCGDYNTRLYLGHSDTRPPEPQRVYGDEAGRVSPDSELEPSRDGDGSVYPDEDGEGRGYDRDYVFHAGGSVISRREWYV